MAEEQVQNQHLENKEATPEVNPLQEQAREMGWKPKEEYEGDPDKWVDESIS